MINKENIRSEKGISLITLMMAVVLLIIITSILAINSNTSLQLSKLTKLQNDIETLEDRVAAYYVEKGKLPLYEDGLTYDPSSLRKQIPDISVNDGNKYYTLDPSLLNVTLNYGNEYDVANSKDKYIINEETHVIYYLEGIIYEGEEYHTIRKKCSNDKLILAKNNVMWYNNIYG